MVRACLGLGIQTLRLPPTAGLPPSLNCMRVKSSASDEADACTHQSLALAADLPSVN